MVHNLYYYIVIFMFYTFYLHGSTRMTSVALYGSMQIAQQSLSISAALLSSDLMFLVGILAIIRLATVHIWRC